MPKKPACAAVVMTTYLTLRITTRLPLQLLMALHDLGETELCTKEACHKLAWTLDACLKVSEGGE